MQLNLIYEGLNIRSSQDIHEGYFYTINDTIKVPYTRTYHNEDGEVTQE